MADTFDYIVADEVQDFGIPEMFFLKSLIKDNSNLFICCDTGQRIYAKHFRLSQLGLDTRGRSFRLKINYRNTEQIKKFSEKVLPDTIEDITGENEERYTISLLKGEKPLISYFINTQEESEFINKKIRELIDSGYQYKDIALFARDNFIISERIEPVLKSLNYPYHKLTESSFYEDKISVGTMFMCKGLEFKVVFLVGCEYDILPFKKVINEATNEDEKNILEMQERQLFYVASTRARELLFITYSGKPSIFLNDIGEQNERG